MNSSEMNEIRRAIHAQHFTWHPRSHQKRDGILTLCTICGRVLGRFENTRNLAFCFPCRQAIYPESFPPKKYRKNKRLKFQPGGRFYKDRRLVDGNKSDLP